jgi:DNA-binding transcriptional ArsR family regulator
MVKKVTVSALEPFLVKPWEKMHLADISRSINEPHPTVRLWLKELEKKGITRKEHKGRLTLHCLNLESPLIVDYLVMAEKYKLIKKCEKWPVLGELVSFTHHNLNQGSKILIFGSAAMSFDSANDIDIFLVGKDNPNVLKKSAQKLGKEAHIIKVKSLNKVSKALKAEIIKKHLLVHGSEDFMRWILW